MKNPLGWALVTLVLIPSHGFARPDTEIRNFHEVSPIVFRSGHLTKAAIKQLPKYGVKTILNLEDPEGNFEREKRQAGKLDIAAVHYGLNPLFAKPSMQRMDEIIEFLKDEQNYPLLIHCNHGEDRTGMVVGLYRVFIEGLAPSTAYQEMLNHGFHPVAQVGLKCAFWEKTGMEVPGYCGLIPVGDDD